MAGIYGDIAAVADGHDNLGVTLILIEVVGPFVGVQFAKIAASL